jgi:chemotaxis protein histidine kinase CheA
LATIDPRLREVRERFLDRLDERLDRIRREAALALTDADAAGRLRREVHNLIGAAGLLGFHDLAAAAEAVDRLLSTESDPVIIADQLGLLIHCGDAYGRRHSPAA